MRKHKPEGRWVRSIPRLHFILKEIMKKLILTLVMLTAFTSCISKTEFGPCIGIDDKKNPALEYKVSGWNVAMGFIFSEMVIPPLFVVFKQLECPVGKADGN